MREIIRSIRVVLVLWVITAVIYPLLMLLVGQTLFPFQANGSLLKNQQGQVIGSALIGQSFSSERYFIGRPSTTNYSSFAAQEYDPQNPDNVTQRTGISGASNLAPSNTAELLKDTRDVESADLLQRIQADVNRLKQANIKSTADLVYTSGSSLDPHISVEAALAQAPRVAQVRALPLDQVQALIAKNTDPRFLGIFGEPGINVLKLNLALDALNTAIQ